jgi:ACT domain-containing protein
LSSNTNYNIKSLNKKQNLIYNFLINRLPAAIRAFKRKSFKSKKTKPTQDSLITAKFIEYNKQVCNFIIVDIDNRNLKISKIYEILNDYNIPFTWLLYTDKGYHIAWALKHPFALNSKYQSESDKKAEKYAKYIQKKLIYLLGGDPAAARLKGIWRNPITHNSIFHINNTYELDELDIYLHELDAQDIKAKKQKKGAEAFHTDPLFIKKIAAEVLENPLKLQEIDQGIRNSLIWYLGMLIAKPFQNLEKSEKIATWHTQILNQINFYNSNLKNPLTTKELKEITQSIFKYYIQKKIRVSLGNYTEWNKTTKNEYMKQYRIKKGIHKQTREKQKNTNFKKVENAIQTTSTITEAINKSGLSKRTFYKYYNQLKEKEKSLYFNKIKGIMLGAKNNCWFTKSIHLKIIEKIKKKELHFIKIRPAIIALNDINTNIKRRQTCRENL